MAPGGGKRVELTENTSARLILIATDVEPGGVVWTATLTDKSGKSPDKILSTAKTSDTLGPGLWVLKNLARTVGKDTDWFTPDEADENFYRLAAPSGASAVYVSVVSKGNGRFVTPVGLTLQ